MQRSLLLMIGLAILSASGNALADDRTADTRVFELRTYYAAPGKLDALHARFREHTTKLFEKHGMTNIGYWVPNGEEDGEPRLVYIIAHRSREAAKENWKAFSADPAWQAVKAASEKDGALLARRPESVFFKPTDYSPLK